MDQVMTAASELSAIVPEVWSARYYDVLLQTLAFNPIISKDWEGEISNLGDTVHINQFPQFDEGTDIAEDQKVDASAITVAQIDLIINKQVAKDFILTKKAMLQSLPAMDKLRELAVYSLMKRMQTIIISLIVPSASSPDHQISYVSGTTLSLADALAAKELLDTQEVPQSGRHFVVGSAQLNDLFNITGFTSSDFITSGAPLQTGQLPPALLGFMPHFTSVVGNTSYWFHESFMTMASQQGVDIEVFNLGVEGKRAARVNTDTLFGVKQLDNKRVVTIS